MTGEPCSLTLDISEHLFRLTTESVRLRSNETKCYQTLADLVTEQVASYRKIDDQSPELMREHLSTVPTRGNVRINIVIAESIVSSLLEAKCNLTCRLGSNISLGDTLSILLFNYVITQRTAQIMRRIRLEKQVEGSNSLPAGGEALDGNVIALR